MNTGAAQSVYNCPSDKQNGQLDKATVTAVALIELGYTVAPAKGRRAADYQSSKQPAFKGWQKGITVSDAKLISVQDYGLVVGVNEVWIDPDTYPALRAVVTKIPRIMRTWGAVGGRGLPRFLVRLPEGVRMGSRSNRALGLDIKGAGSFMLINSTFTDEEGKTYRHIARDYVEPITLTEDEYKALLELLPAEEIDLKPIERNTTGFDAVGAYRAIKTQYDRNDALYRAVIRARRRGLSFDEIEAALLSEFVHDTAPADHKPQSSHSRNREGLATIKSAFRAKLYYAIKGDPIGLPESAREALLQNDRHQDARILDAIYASGQYQIGDKLRVNDVYSTLRGLGLSIGKISLVDALKRIGDTLPSPEAVCTELGVQEVIYTSISIEDCATVATYKDAMDKRLFERRPDYYWLRWQANRLGNKSRSTALRRRRRIGAKVRNDYTRVKLDYQTIGALPENAHDAVAGNPYTTWIETDEGVKIPAYKYAAIRALQGGAKALTLVQYRVFVWIQESGSGMERNNNIVLRTAKPSTTVPAEPTVKPNQITKKQNIGAYAPHNDPEAPSSVENTATAQPPILNQLHNETKALRRYRYGALQKAQPETDQERTAKSAGTARPENSAPSKNASAEFWQSFADEMGATMKTTKARGK